MAAVNTAVRSLGGPTTSWRRNSSSLRMSTTTHALSSADSSSAQRCRVTDSLKVAFSRSSRVAAVMRSRRWVAPATARSADLARLLRPLFDPRHVGTGAGAPLDAPPDPATATISGSGSPVSSTRSNIISVATLPPTPASWQRTRRGLRVRTTALSWLFIAALPERSTNAVRGFPVVYPAGTPSSAPAWRLALRTLPSVSSRKIGVGAPSNTARSRRRSALAVPGRLASSGTAEMRARSFTSMSRPSSSSIRVASRIGRRAASGIRAA